MRTASMRWVVVPFVLACGCLLATPVGSQTARIVLEATENTPTTGRGAQIAQARPYDVTVPNGSDLSLVELAATNRQTTAQGGALYLMRLFTTSYGSDTGAALFIQNGGRADALYVGLAGLPGPVSNNTPTGVGMNVNATTDGTAENSSTFNGYGIQIWDYSTTSGNDAQLLRLRKHRDYDTSNELIRLEGNRRLIEMFVNPTTPRYSATVPVFVLRDETRGGAPLYTLQADGGVAMTRGLALDGGAPGDHGITLPAATPSDATSRLYSPDGVRLFYGGREVAFK